VYSSKFEAEKTCCSIKSKETWETCRRKKKETSIKFRMHYRREMNKKSTNNIAIILTKKMTLLRRKLNVRKKVLMESGKTTERKKYWK
jgi:hypothetical protein